MTWAQVYAVLEAILKYLERVFIDLLAGGDRG